MRSRSWWASGAVAAALCAALLVPSGGTAFAAGTDRYPVRGIDVSSNDHSGAGIDWPAVATSGVTFAYVKATEGTSYVNPYFARDYRAARANGMYVGAYAFARPDLGDPVGQADYFIDHAAWASDSRTLVPFLDLEWPYEALQLPACWGLAPDQMSAWIHGFLDETQARTGRKPMIYTNSNWWNPCTGADPSFGGYPLDIAGYGDRPPKLPAGWTRFALWQYAPGDNSVAGRYDADVYNGDLIGLLSLAGPTAPSVVVSLRAHATGRFVSAETGGAPLAASRGAVAPSAQFDEIDLGGGYVALRSHANGRYVTAETAGAAPLVANRVAVGPWERFLLVPNADGSVSLRAGPNGRFVTVAAGLSPTLVADRAAAGAAESFDLVPPPTPLPVGAPLRFVST